MKAYLNRFDGNKDDIFTRLIEKEVEGVRAVYIDALAYRAFHPLF